MSNAWPEHAWGHCARPESAFARDLATSGMRTETVDAGSMAEVWEV